MKAIITKQQVAQLEPPVLRGVSEQVVPLFRKGGKSVPALIALLLIAGQATAGEQVISVQHDSTRDVTCWITPQGGISCLPDSSLLQTPASTASDETQAARASLATSMCQSGQLPAAKPPQEKGFHL